MSLKKLLELAMVRRILRKRRRNIYIRPIFANRIRRGEMHLVEELANDPYYHHRYFRYLATGQSQVSLALSYRISPSSVGIILRETLHAIWEELNEDFMKSPQNSEEWKSIADEYDRMWNFPHCVGTMDGKHIRVKHFAKTGSLNFNYKKHFSIVLFISADAHYKISYVDIGAPGSQSDSAILQDSDFGEQLYSNTLPLPPPSTINSSETIFPYVFLGDAGFQLRSNLLTPYTIHNHMSQQQKVLNLRLSRARRISENVFGLLVSRWRIFKTEIEADKNLAVLIVKAATVLHNYLMSKRDLGNLTIDTENDDGTITSGNWRDYVQNDTGYRNIRSSNNYSNTAKEIRDSFARFFVSPEGSVPWQIRQVNRGYDINEM